MKNLCNFHPQKMTTFLWRFVKKKEVYMLKTPINREIRSFAPPRASSIKTRIKTRCLACGTRSTAFGPPRASSIKTRIKTLFKSFIASLRDSLREHLPLKQGLRLCLLFNRHNIVVKLREHLPLKQGLRLNHRHPHRPNL